MDMPSLFEIECTASSGASIILHTCNDHGTSMGESAFHFRKVLICHPVNLLMYEQQVLDCVKPEYNTAPTAGSSRGRKTSEETKKRLAISIRGLKRSEETKARMSESRRSRLIEPVVSEATRLKQSDMRKGIKRPPRTAEHARKLALSRRKFTDHQIRDMKSLIKSGTRQSVVARQFGCSAAFACKLASGKSHSQVE